MRKVNIEKEEPWSAYVDDTHVYQREKKEKTAKDKRK